jgi:hypothetical protein
MVEWKNKINFFFLLWKGIKPTLRSYSSWNFKIIDPPAAVFAKEVLNNKSQGNIVNELEKLGTSYYQPSPGTNFSRTSRTSDKKSSSMASSMNRRRHALLQSDIDDLHSGKSSRLAQNFFRSAKIQESHPVWY